MDEEDRQSSHARKQDVLQKTRLPLRRAFRSRTTNKISGKAEISLLRPAHLYAAGDVAALQVEVQVPIHKSFEPGTKVFMPDNGYWKESSVSVPDGLSPGDVVTVELLAEPKRSKMTLKDVKADIELRVTGPSVTPGGPEMIILRQYVAFDGIDFAGDLFPIPLSPSLGTAPLLLYILGAEQAGKTTFVESLRNVLASAETDMPPPQTSIVPTTEITRLELNAEAISPRFRAPLTARVTEIPSSMVLAPTDADKASMERLLPAGHGALVFVAADEVETAPAKMAGLQASIQQLKAQNFNPLVVLTRMDKVEPLVAADPFNWSLKKVSHVRRRASQCLGVSWANTLVFVPYAAPRPAMRPEVAKASMRTDVIIKGKKASSILDMREDTVREEGMERSFAIDKLVLFIAKAGLEVAQEKMEGRVRRSSSAGSAGLGTWTGGRITATPKTDMSMTKTAPSDAMLATRQQTVELDGSFSSNFPTLSASTPQP